MNDLDLELIQEMPIELIHQTVDDFAKKLWELVPKPKSKEVACAIGGLEEDMICFLISNLYACSIVKHQDDNENVNND